MYLLMQIGLVTPDTTLSLHIATAGSGCNMKPSLHPNTTDSLWLNDAPVTLTYPLRGATGVIQFPEKNTQMKRRNDVWVRVAGINERKIQNRKGFNPTDFVLDDASK